MAASAQLKESPQARMEEIMGAVRPTIVHIIEEVKLSLSYYENQIGVAVDNINLCGGLSGFRGIVDIFKESTGVECSLWDPLKRIALDDGLDRDKLAGMRSRLPVALGLAARG